MADPQATNGTGAACAERDASDVGDVSDVGDARDEGAGRVVAVRGAVVDVAFDGGALPALNEALTIPVDGAAPILAEVHAHLSDAAVRALALGPTGGLRRGAAVR
ncbi:F0F1 ATP synthase subunit beta, partial [Burkholderia pseudomallei]|nr:F0F1 ATP synthase subunit beta [Burkholderia pseudomallei]